VLLLFSVFFIKTTTINNFLSDTDKLSNHQLIADVRLFFVSILFFIPMFMQLFDKKRKENKVNLHLISDIIQESFSKIKEVEDKAVTDLNQAKQSFHYPANFMLIFMISFHLFLLLF
jgi:hypothetical protein